MSSMAQLPEDTVCTTDTMTCPNGKAVPRDPSIDCEFQPCIKSPRTLTELIAMLRGICSKHLKSSAPEIGGAGFLTWFIMCTSLAAMVGGLGVAARFRSRTRAVEAFTSEDTEAMLQSPV